jgi:hypothetical protein
VKKTKRLPVFVDDLQVGEAFLGCGGGVSLYVLLENLPGTQEIADLFDEKHRGVGITIRPMPSQIEGHPLVDVQPDGDLDEVEENAAVNAVLDREIGKIAKKYNLLRWGRVQRGEGI